jgi:hypothetical protein
MRKTVRGYRGPQAISRAGGRARSSRDLLFDRRKSTGSELLPICNRAFDRRERTDLPDRSGRGRALGSGGFAGRIPFVAFEMPSAVPHAVAILRRSMAEHAQLIGASPVIRWISGNAVLDLTTLTTDTY